MNTPQSPHWLDTLAADILEWQKKAHVSKLHVDDMKTPSGRVHTGSLRGVLLHDFVAKVLSEKTGQAITSTYVFNDMDPMDGLPAYLDQDEYRQHMGKPLHQIPAPNLERCGIDLSSATEEERADFESATTFAEFYAYDFIHAFRKLGCTQKIVWSHELYESGKMDESIKIALNEVAELKAIYHDVAEYDLPENWYPFQVICPNCGKVGTTLTTNWDGEMVTYDCQTDKVDWAQGCGHTGTISPFGGTGKLLWKVDWPAHWHTMGINVEGAGKDHTTAGGSRDMANAQCERVFKTQTPFDIPYEWILIRGTKMSSSKGIGTSAREFTELFPPEIGRFLFINKHYNQVIDFDPHSLSIPDLFDEFDQGARIYWGHEEGDTRLGRSFELSFVDTPPQPLVLPRFRDIANWMQYPEKNIVEELENIKGEALNEREQKELKHRMQYAQLWLDRYAAEEYIFRFSEALPEAANQLSQEDRDFVSTILELVLANPEMQPEELQQAIFTKAKESVGARQGFKALYTVLIDKTHGPRAGWLLQSIEKKALEARLNAIRSIQNPKNVQDSSFDLHGVELKNGVDSQLSATFPGMHFAYLVISDVQIAKHNPELELAKQRVIESIESEGMSSITNSHPIQEYRGLLKSTGTNPTKNRPSPEALRRRVVKEKGLYTINTAVDAYNLAVLETGVGLGGFNLDALETTHQTLRFSHEGEQMLLHGDDAPTSTRKGQIVYSDNDRPTTIDLNYRDIVATSIQSDTKNILLVADGAPGISPQETVSALLRGAELIQQFCGGSLSTIYLAT